MAGMIDLDILIKKLKKDFPVKLYKPGYTIEELAYNSGQQKVIDYIENMGKPR